MAGQNLFRTVAIAFTAGVLAACSGTGGENVPGDSADTRPFSEITENHVLRLTGTEPFWGGSIEGEFLVWTTPDLPDGEQFVISRFAGRGGISFSGESPTRRIDVVVTPADCSDGMSDRNYPYVALVHLGTERFEGCAWREGVDDLGEP